MSFRQIILAIGALATCACTHGGETATAEAVDAGRCEEAARHVGLGTLERSAAKAQELGGTATSYGVAAAGYTADVVITGSTGIVSLLVFCPLTAAQLASCASGHCFLGDVSGSCFDDPLRLVPESDEKAEGPTIGPGLGAKALTATSSWRANPGSVTLAEDMRRVAACYERRDRRDDLIKANIQLQQIHTAKLYDQLPSAHRREVDRAIARVRARLDVVAPGYQVEAERQQQELARRSLKQEAPALWHDLSSGNLWRLQTAPVASAAVATKLCAGIASQDGQLWQLPSRGDIDKALRQGLSDTAKNPEFAAKLQGSPRRAFVRAGDDFVLVNLTSGESSHASATDAAEALLCLR